MNCLDVSLALATGLIVSMCAWAEDPKVEQALSRPIIGSGQTLTELQEYLDWRVPRMPTITTGTDWEQMAATLRRRVFEEVVFRGEAARWRDGKTRVERLGSIAGGPGYTIHKLRYEVIPGLWAPALLYEPEQLTCKVPVSLAVNGHDGKGKAADYKQTRCINMAKRGMIVLSAEWLGMGQLRGPGFRHYTMNQLDLCGTSGIAPFYLAMSRALDILLTHPHADPRRVAVSGLSGGGWQTIFISSLDTRVTLANPVAGYSSFRTRIKHHKDLGDSEQTPCDLATVVDYTHLTALLAPRPTLLTYNAKDDCCFESGYALPPLEAAAKPVFKLLGAETSIRTHINSDPGDHNFGKDNRQAFYRMLGDQFFQSGARFEATEIDCEKELKKSEELTVELPANNADFNVLAGRLSRALPIGGDLPSDRGATAKWQAERRALLGKIVRTNSWPAEGSKNLGQPGESPGKVAHWRLNVGDRWSVPAVELTPEDPKQTTILIGDAGRAKLATHAGRLLAAGHRVVAVDLFYFGESALPHHAALFALLHAAVGDRPLGLQATQLAAVARWTAKHFGAEKVQVEAVGPRNSTIALIAAALETRAIGSVQLHDPLASLKELIEQNRTVDQSPELFCFGLLEQFDVGQIAALVAPRPVHVVRPSERVRRELAPLRAWYRTLGSDHDPLSEK